MTSRYGVIFAGGQGERLGGVRKADIRIGGVRLLDRVAQVLGALETPLLVATGPRANTLALEAQFLAVSDEDGVEGGPLAGLAAAVLALRSQGISDAVLLSVAVDTPFLPADYVDRLMAALATAPAAFAGWRNDFYPPNAAWTLDSIVDLPERLGEIGSLKALHQQIGSVRVGWDEAQEDPFGNLNTLADLVALGKRANRLARL